MGKKQKQTRQNKASVLVKDEDSDEDQQQQIDLKTQKKTKQQIQQESDMDSAPEDEDISDQDYGSDQDESNDNDSHRSLLSGEDCVSVHDEKEEKILTPEELDQRKKQRRIEKLEKRIKQLQKNQEKQKGKKTGKFERLTTDIKNKQKRQEVVILRKMNAREQRKLKLLQTKKLREELGEEAVPKGKVITIDMQRVKDETLIDDPNDEELIGQTSIDEFDKYFNRQVTPKILVTTNRRPKGDLFPFLKEIKLTFPNVEYYPRQNFRIKEIIEWSKERGFTHIMVFQEKWGKPHSMILSYLPEGPTATFRVSGIVLNEDIPNHGANNGALVAPELILNNFDTMLGSRIGRLIASLFPQDPQLEKRRVCTWHNQRDFIFFRHHRYEFTPDGRRANLSEVGPRFTLKLHKLQLGTLDSKFGEYEFLYKPKDGVDRKKFFL